MNQLLRNLAILALVDLVVAYVAYLILSMFTTVSFLALFAAMFGFDVGQELARLHRARKACRDTLYSVRASLAKQIN